MPFSRSSERSGDLDGTSVRSRRTFGGKGKTKSTILMFAYLSGVCFPEERVWHRNRQTLGLSTENRSVICRAHGVPIPVARHIKFLYRRRAEQPAHFAPSRKRACDTALTFVGTNPMDESIVSDLPVVLQLFGNPMLCTLLTQRLPYFEVSGDSCPLWPRS